MSLMVFQLSQRTQWSLKCVDKKEEVSWLFSSKVTCLPSSDWCVVSLTDAREGGRGEEGKGGSWRMVLKQPIRGLSHHNVDDQLTVWHFLCFAPCLPLTPNPPPPLPPRPFSECVMFIKSYFTRGGDWGGLHNRVHLREDRCWGNSGWGDAAGISNWAKKREKTLTNTTFITISTDHIHGSWSGKLQQRLQQADGDSLPAGIPQSRIWIQQRLVDF